MPAERQPAAVVLVRHGATDWSQVGRHTGWTDIDLNNEGIRQAEAVRRPLQRWSFDAVLCSPLRRALTTCEIAGLGPVMQLDPDLREWNYGDYEGLTTADIRERRPGWVIWDDGVAGGETIDQVAVRADRVIARLRSLHGTVAVFAHGHLLRILASRWLGHQPRLAQHLLLSTASISQAAWEHDWPSLTFWNDTEHLRRE